MSISIGRDENLNVIFRHSGKNYDINIKPTTSKIDPDAEFYVIQNKHLKSDVFLVIRLIFDNKYDYVDILVDQNGESQILPVVFEDYAQTNHLKAETSVVKVEGNKLVEGDNNDLSEKQRNYFGIVWNVFENLVGDQEGKQKDFYTLLLVFDPNFDLSATSDLFGNVDKEDVDFDEISKEAEELRSEAETVFPPMEKEPSPVKKSPSPVKKSPSPVKPTIKVGGNTLTLQIDFVNNSVSFVSDTGETLKWENGQFSL